MPAASCPGRGTTRRLMSRCRLSRAKAARENSPAPSGGGAEPGDTAPAARAPAAPCGTASPPGELGQTNIRGLRRRPRARAGRQGPPRAPEAFLPGRGGPPGPAPTGRPPPEGPEGPSSTAPKLLRARERLAPWGSRGSPTARIGAPLPRRERATFRTEETGGAQAYRTLRAGGGTRPGPQSATTAEPRSRLRDRHSPVRRLPPEPPPPNPGPEGPCSGSRSRRPTIRRFRVASKPCAIQENRQDGNL